MSRKKAPNDLLYKTCLATPDSPLCYGAATFFQCTRHFLYLSFVEGLCQTETKSIELI